MRNREFAKGIACGLCLAVAVAAGGKLGERLSIGSRSVLSDREHVQKIKYLENLIEGSFYEEADEEKMAEGLYAGLLYGLEDPYSRYYTAEEYMESNTSTQGSYVGIGIVMGQNREGGMSVVLCYEGGPAQKAGLKEGDILSAVNGTDVTDYKVSEVADMIKGCESESVVLTVHRENVEEPLEITVPVTDVEIPSVFSEMLENQVGYIRITEFKGVTHEQYKKAFSDLKDQGMRGLVVDLRDNPGGLLTSVCDILREILPEGLIVYTEDKYGKRDEQTCEGKNPIDIPLSVLVNESSASASEIFAGAVKDYGVGTVVGTTTFGKGVVQNVIPLKDGSAVKLTVSKYFTPKGNDIHEVGIIPDVEVKLDAKLLNKAEIGKEEDNQLAAAVAALGI